MALKQFIVACVMATAWAGWAPTAEAESVLATRVIDKVGFTTFHDGPFTTLLRFKDGGSNYDLFDMPISAASIGTTYVFSSNADAADYDTIVGLLTNGTSQDIRFNVFASASIPIGVLQSEQDFFGLGDIDLAGETISRIEFRVDNFSTAIVGNPFNNGQPAQGGGGGNNLTEITFLGQLSIIGPGTAIVPTPTAASAGLVLLLGMLARRRRSQPPM